MAEAAPAGLLGALPEGWVMLGRCRSGTAGPVGYPTGCWALAHPATGIALVDVAPDATPNAEARTRRALGAANFWAGFPGTLPVWHGRIELAAWRSLPAIMAEGFSELPPLTVPGKAAWMSAARAALAEDPAWDVPGAAPPALRSLSPMDQPEEEDAVLAIEGRPARRRRLGLALGFLATFVVGVASGMMLLSGKENAPEGTVTPAATVAPAPSVSVTALPVTATVPPPAATPARDAVAPPPPAPVPGAEPVQVTATVTVASAPPELVASDALPLPSTAVQAYAGADTAPVQVASASLPLPPLAPRAPVQKAARPPDRIDPACTKAVFRFQQGLALTPAEQAHVRNGCATRR